ncbi:nitroreductase family protein [Kribbella voronezhensis]|uniref:Nitroreductase family protein n=1 Tax=Kribbella voronezhensis TaxID=2512212 RepID=A0A4R7SWQ8_9ACTN|nr:nitroreductase [Kribbella voronezhensis]TDU83792.1 nitroreductase family protein [Kribbella voronezhensis]
MLTPTGQDRDELLRAAVAAPSMHNTQPWKFRFTGSVIEVYRDRSRELPAEDPDRRMLYLSLGAAVFNLKVAAADLAYGAVVRSVLDRARPDLVAEVELTAGGAELEQLRQLAPSVRLRRTNRRPYSRERIPVGARKLLDLSARLEGSQLQWLDDETRVNWVHLATADANQEDDRSPTRTGERRLWVGGQRSVDGIPTGSLGPRPDRPGAPVRDMAATPADANRVAAAFETSPQLAILATRRDGPAEWLRAGQAMERVLLEATAAGLATSLLNQAIEHDTLRWLLHDPLGAWTRPQAVIRFGYGPAVPATPRRPIADVLLP